MVALWALLRLRLGPASVRVWVGHWVIYSLLAGHHKRVDYPMTYPPCDGYLQVVVGGLLLCIYLVYYICCWCGSWALRHHSLVSAVSRITWPIKGVAAYSCMSGVCVEFCWRCGSLGVVPYSLVSMVLGTDFLAHYGCCVLC